MIPLKNDKIIEAKTNLVYYLWTNKENDVRGLLCSTCQIRSLPPRQ
jgi:hypothetical protein